jgi:hypothetical protein
MQVSDLQNLINYRRRDLTESFISSDEILAYLNEGNRKATSEYEYEWNKVSTVISYTDGFRRYAISSLAPDLDEPINFFHSPSEYFNVVSPEEFMSLSGNSQNMVAVDGNYMLMETSFGSGNVSMNYYTSYTAQTSAGSVIPNMIDSTDSPLMPEQFQDMLVDFGAARCYQKEGMYDDYHIAMTDFKDALKKIKSKIPSRKKHNPVRIGSPRKAAGYGIADKSDPLNNL